MRDVNRLNQSVLARDELTGLPVVALTDEELSQVAGANNEAGSYTIECASYSLA